MNRVAYLFGAMAIAGFMAIPAFAQDSPSSKVTGVVQNGNRTIVFENNNAGLNLDQISAFSQVKAADPDSNCRPDTSIPSTWLRPQNSP